MVPPDLSWGSQRRRNNPANRQREEGDLSLVRNRVTLATGTSCGIRRYFLRHLEPSKQLNCNDKLLLCCGFLPQTVKNRIIHNHQHGCYLYPTAETLIIQPNKRRKSAPSAKVLPEKTLITVQLPAATNCYIIIPSSAALIEFYSNRYSSAAFTTRADIRPCCRISTTGLPRLSSKLKKKMELNCHH